MNNYNVGIIVTARVKSSRIENKVLQKIGNRMAIEVLLDNIINNKHEVVLAIPESEENDILEEIGVNKGVLVHRGQDDSPLHRIAAVIKDYNYDYIVRITADDILIDLQLLFNQVNFAIRQSWEYVYMHKCIEGTAGEVIKSDILLKEAENLDGKSIEFVSYYLKNRYKTKEYYPPFEFQNPFRCVLDYPEDLMLVKILFCMLPDPVKSLDIIHFLKKNYFLTHINKLPEVTVYTCNYNTGKYIADTIKSVMGQTYTDVEYIIIDDHSTDDSMNVIFETLNGLTHEQRQKIKVVRNDENLGLSASSNLALSMAKGKYIMRVDSDDVIKDNCLKMMHDEMKIESVNGVLSGFDTVDENLEKIEYFDENEWHPGCSLLSTWACNEIKYKEDIKYLDGKYFFDEWRKIFKTSFIKESLWSYRQREGQKTQEKEHPNNQ